MRAPPPPRLPALRAALIATALACGLAASPSPARAGPAAPVASGTAEITGEGCGCQTTSGGRRTLGAAASAAMAVAGVVLLVRRFRQRSRLPSEDNKFGSYRGPKKD